MKTVIFGNSGSGKSTLAKAFATSEVVAYLDLDTIAFKADEPGVREDLPTSLEALRAFTDAHAQWVVEGCYGSLLPAAMATATSIFFLNPGVEACIENCRNRPWEAHKYDSPEAQDKNLSMLLDWVRTYETRDDEFGQQAHQRIFAGFAGEKHEITTKAEAARLAKQIPTDG